MMPDSELEALAEDIKAHGQEELITLWASDSGEDYLLDGRNRMAACRRAGVEPQVAFSDVDDPTAYIISMNIHRRHLSKQQRAELIVAAIQAELVEEKPAQDETVYKGGRGKKNPVREKAVAAGAAHGISEATIRRAMQPERTEEEKKAAREAAEKKAIADYDCPDLHRLRQRYLDALVAQRANLDEEMSLIVEAFKEIAGQRLKK